MSHALRRMQRAGKSPPKFSSYGLESLWREDRLPTPQQQADNLILWIGGNQPTQFDFAEDRVPAIAATIGLPISGVSDSQGFGWTDKQLEGKGLYIRGEQGGRVKLQLTMGGWERFSELQRRDLTSRTAFMAMKFGDAALNRVVDECFRPAVDRAGFQLRLLTDDQPAGLIDDQLRAAILASRFVISDLTHGNRGAYWEAGYAEGLALPVIYTCEKTVWEKEKTHFDTKSSSYSSLGNFRSCKSRKPAYGYHPRYLESRSKTIRRVTALHLHPIARHRPPSNAIAARTSIRSSGPVHLTAPGPTGLISAIPGR